MDYRPGTVTWQLTMRCNMHCKHCLFACGKGSPEELTTKETQELARDLADLGVATLWLASKRFRKTVG